MATLREKIQNIFNIQGLYSNGKYNDLLTFLNETNPDDIINDEIVEFSEYDLNIVKCMCLCNKSKQNLTTEDLNIVQSFLDDIIDNNIDIQTEAKMFSDDFSNLVANYIVTRCRIEKIEYTDESLSKYVNYINSDNKNLAYVKIQNALIKSELGDYTNNEKLEVLNLISSDDISLLESKMPNIALDYWHRKATVLATINEEECSICRSKVEELLTKIYGS